MNKEIRSAILFIAPLAAFVSLFLLFPIIGTIWTSFWQDVSFLPSKFVGFDNFVRLLKDNNFWQSIIFTLVFSVVSVAIELILGTMLALILNEQFRGQRFMRTAALLSWVIPSVIGARVWQLIYRYDYGLANYLIAGLTGGPVNWLGNATAAFASVVLTDVWRTTPFVAIIVLAGLQSVSKELYEQAMIDGANIMKRFLHITLPAIRPVLIVALLFRTIDALRVFDLIYVITGGGPGGTTTPVSLYAYKYFLGGDFGYGSTISVGLFVVAFIIALVYVKVGKFKEAVI